MNPFGTPKVGTGSASGVDDEHVSGEVPDEAHATVASPSEPEAPSRPLVEPEPGVHLPQLRIPSRATIEEAVVSPVSKLSVSSPHGSVETPHTSRPVSALGPRADTTVAFANLRNRYGRVPPPSPPSPSSPHSPFSPFSLFGPFSPNSPHSPNTPHVNATPRHDEAEPGVKLGEAEHEAFPEQLPHDTQPHDTQPHDAQPHDTHPHDAQPHDTQPHDTQPHDTQPHDTQPHDTQPHDTQPHDTQPHDTQPHDTQPHDAQPHNAPNSAAQFAQGTMEQTGEFMSPMIQAQMFAAESQMFISMVQAQVDVAKAAASAVADAARKS